MLTAQPLLAANAAGELLGRFGVSWPTFAASVLNFALVAAVLYYFAIRPVLKTLDERNAKIEEGLRFSEEMKAKLAAAEAQYEARLATAAAESAKILNAAAAHARAAEEKAAKDAAAHAAEILERADAQIAQEHGKMLAELRGEVATLVVETVAKVLSTQLTDAEKQRFNTAATDALANHVR